MAYSKQTWANDDPTTPIDADRLGHIEAGIEAAASAADAAATAKVAKAGDTMSGDLAMGGHRVTGLADPAAAQDAATKAWTAAQIAALVNSAPGILDTLGEIAAALQADESAAATLTALVATKAQALTRTAVKTTSYTAAPGDLVPVDTTSAAVTVTLPTAPAVGSRVAAKLVILGAGHAVTLACGGSDVFNKTGGATTATLTLLNQAMQVQYDGGVWTVVADDLPKSALDAAYAPLTETLQTFPASGAAVTVADPSTAGSMVDITLTANCTITLPTPVAGRSFTVRLTQDGTGSRVPTWAVTGGSTIKWPSAINPGASTTPGAQDVFTFFSISGAAWNGGVVGRDFR